MAGIQLPEQENAAFRALGNAVNTKIVKLIAEQLIKESHKNGKIVKKKYSLAHEVA